MRDVIIGKEINTLYKDIISYVSEYGMKSSPRGSETKEVIDFSFVLEDPLKSVCTIKARKLNYAFMTIERCEHLSGESSVPRVLHYNSKMQPFVSLLQHVIPTILFNGAYGPRIKNQLVRCYELLKIDPDTRQAVITIRNDKDFDSTPDVPCTLSLQFILRKGRLNLITTMRSNDVLLGVPYDVASFCYLQLHLACWLGVGVGSYHHHAGSMHIYERDRVRLNDILQDNETVDFKNILIGKEKKETEQFLKEFWIREQAYREGNFIVEPKTLLSGLRENLQIIYDYNQRKFTK